MYPEKDSSWKPRVSLCSSIHNEGISDVWKMISEYKNQITKNGYFAIKRNEQNKFWLIQTIENQLKSEFFNNKKIKKELKLQLKQIENQKTTPFAAAEYLLNL